MAHNGSDVATVRPSVDVYATKCRCAHEAEELLIVKRFGAALRLMQRGLLYTICRHIQADLRSLC